MDSQANKPVSTAPRGLRWFIWLLSALWTLLLIWLFGFMLRDIGRLKGPDYQVILTNHVQQSQLDRQEALRRQIDELETRIRRQQEIQGTLRQSLDNARATMEQLAELYRLSLERGVEPSEAEKEAMATSQQRFLEAQNEFEQANSEITQSNQVKFERGRELAAVEREIEMQREPAGREYERQRQRHEFKVATLKLALIVPFFLAAAWLVHRYRQSLFRPVFLAGLAATFWKVGTVMFEHFPRDFFKYIAMTAAVSIVLAFLVWLLRSAGRPNPATQLKRHREAYAGQRCPNCAFPIGGVARLRGRKARRAPAIGVPFAPAEASEESKTRHCPSCGVSLFEKCEACGATRHSLLPFCERCGDGRDRRAVAV